MNQLNWSGRYAKRGLLYSVISTIGLAYALFFDLPIRWFGVLMWSLILGLGLYLIFFKKDEPV